ncbi:hypothetical protein Moror_3405 [Moniliophthora roreri MCA 2997]|uniref:Uncharacterized protein n=1 Tax=Moniliophthora roreri (strain MCA 2997) TaxID=1381753 RepID=V2WJ65_MONRO|nr:hypothetical protein Moror_3405 [Moniliophthora roreri MCA 2997]
METILDDIFKKHPKASNTEDGTVVIPADALPDVFHSFSELYGGGVELLTPEEEEMLHLLLKENPGIECSAALLLNFIAEKTKASPSPPQTPQHEEFTRGRSMDPNSDDDYGGRSSSTDSTGTHRHPSRPSSRSGSTVPQTPRAPSGFDSSKRQRATPLHSNPPSAYSRRPTAPHRRKSDAGSRSDSESYSPSSYGYRNAAPRTRAPSNPTSPTPGVMSPNAGTADFAEVGSPTFRPPSRPASRQARLFGEDRGYSSPDHDDTLNQSISSLPMPRHSSSSDSDSEDEDSLGLVMDRRESTASTVSLEPIDRLEVLQKANAELGKKLMEAENTLQRKLTEHETELEDLQVRIDELRSELSATKKEEKELRSKERTSSNQITTLENEISKLNRQLEHARTNYQSLHRQYLEQCSFSEKYRDDLRQRDETVRSLTDAAQVHEMEGGKWSKEREVYEERIGRLEEELVIAQQAMGQLEEQKQENLMLKETIDRMRFDMDELRNSLASGLAGGGGPGSGASSRNNTVSKSLGAELAGKMSGWGEDEEDVHDEDDDIEDGSETVVEEIDGDDEEDEDVVQTIIRRRIQRKVPSRANRTLETTQTFEEVKEYSDSSTQYEPALFLVASSSQTDPPPPSPKRVVVDVQTEVIEEPVEPTPERVEMEIQTDPVGVVVEVKKEEPDPVASSSKQTLEDSPPAYDEEAEIQRRVAAELRKLHGGLDGDIEVSEGLLEEWSAFKDELGVGCGVIDQVLAKSRVRRKPQVKEEEKEGKRGYSRFYRNIYNTYISPSSSSPPGAASNIITQTAIVAGSSALVVGALALVQMALAGTGMGPQYGWGVPGGPTYHDRVAWASFNALPGGPGEGFAGGYGGGGGAAEVFNFLGRVGDGAARIVRGWPT